ncbi:MAG: Adenylate cyclase Guanylate cyclase, partial [Phenylobacterium sp.]|nr:Adenylate cyclase Guanylate cyclase [Phenylobacterium sp.]
MHDHDASPVSPAGRGDVPRAVAFGPFRLLLAERRLERDGKTVRIGGRALDILIALAAQPGRVVSKAQLSEAAWPGMVVEEANLRFHIGVLRKALDPGASSESFITTVAGRGYRLRAPVTRQPVGSTTRARPADDDASRALVGREAQEAELGRLLNLAAAGEAQFAFVTGEAGIGKTALMARFMHDAAAVGARVVTGCCLPGSAETDPYYPILDILMRLAGADGPEDFAAVASRVAPTWAVQLPAIAEEASAGGWQDVLGATHHRMARELCALLEILAKEQLRVLVLEDIQWADLATLDLLRAIAHRRLKARLLVVATLRYAGMEPAASARSARLLCESLSVYHLASEIPLSPLTRDNVAEYLTRTTGLRAASELSLHLHARSGGNPLFMQTMVDYWLQNGLVTPDQDGWGHDISELKTPPTLARLIEGGIEQLAPDRQGVIHAASVSEGAFSAAINHVASPLDEATFEEACEDLARTTALIGRGEVQSLPDGRRVQGYAFRHMILRDFAYERQSVPQRAAAHAAVATEIEKIYRHDLAPVAGVLARHFLAAEDPVAAVKYLRLAARVALARFSTREAAAALEQALGVAQHYPLETRDEIEVEIKEELTPLEAGPFDPRAPDLYAQLASDAGRVGRLDIQCRAILGEALVSAWSYVGRGVELFR